jgi:hypothetical protein
VGTKLLSYDFILATEAEAFQWKELRAAEAAAGAARKEC